MWKVGSNNCRSPDPGDGVDNAGGGTVLGSGWLDEVRPRWSERVVGPDEGVMVGRGRG